jgi:hypothetical protein
MESYTVMAAVALCKTPNNVAHTLMRIVSRRVAMILYDY